MSYNYIIIDYETKNRQKNTLWKLIDTSWNKSVCLRQEISRETHIKCKHNKNKTKKKN